MEDAENLTSSYQKLINRKETTVDELPLHSDQEQQGSCAVTMSTLKPESRINHYKLLVVSQTVLAVILLAVTIGLGVYYNTLTNGNIVRDMSSEMARLQTSYDAAVRNRDDAQKQLATERNQLQVLKWELDHQNIRIKDYEKQTEKLQMDIATVKSHLPMLREGCRHCLPGWTFISSRCFFFPFSDSLYRTTWQAARQFCQRQGGDLAIIDNREKNLAVSQLVNSDQEHSRSFYISGFWIGLRDTEEEGVWKWLDGRRLREGFWAVGEPNNQDNEDCAATYPRQNPFMSWNDAPCTHKLKWICEMSPRSMG